MAELRKRVHDFDRARAEKRKRVEVLMVGGVEHEIPASPPMGFVLFVDQIQKDYGSDHEPGVDEVMEMLKLAVGGAVFDAIVADGAELADLETLLEVITDIWSGSDEEGDEGEADAPAEGAGSDTSEGTGG